MADMTEAHARAILADHAAGTHDAPARTGVDDDGCPHPRCDEAYWQIAQLDEQHDTVFAGAPPGLAAAYNMHSVSEVLASAPRGLPRPRHTSGLPVPWIANDDDLGDANAFRRAACIALRLCQVCGLPLGETSVVCWRAGDELIVDGAALHPEGCWPLARRHCPELAQLEASGQLLHAEVPTGDLEQVDTGPRSIEAGMPIGYAVPEHA